MGMRAVRLGWPACVSLTGPRCGRGVAPCRAPYLRLDARAHAAVPCWRCDGWRGGRSGRKGVGCAGGPACSSYVCAQIRAGARALMHTRACGVCLNHAALTVSPCGSIAKLRFVLLEIVCVVAGLYSIPCLYSIVALCFITNPCVVAGLYGVLHPLSPA